MVELTPPTPTAVVQAPQSKVGSDAFALPQRVGIGQGLEKLGAGLGDVADSMAQDQAQQDLKNQASMATQRDANGNPIIATPPTSFILGKAGDDYVHAMNAGTLAHAQSDITQRMTELRNQFPNDPDQFQAAVNSWAETTRRNNTAGLGNTLANEIHTQGIQHWSNLFDANIKQQINNSQGDLERSNQDTFNQMKTLARSGGMDTPEYGKLNETLGENYRSLLANKQFGYTQDRVSSEINDIQSQLDAEHTIGQADDQYTKHGKAAAQKFLTENILNNSNLQLKDGEREQLYKYGMAHLDYLTSGQKAQIDANRQTMQDLKAALSTNKDVPQSVIDGAISRSQALGDDESVMQIHAYQDQNARMRPYRGLNDEQTLRAMTTGGPVISGINNEAGAIQYFQSKGWSREQAAGIVGNLVHESGGKLDPNAVNKSDGRDGSDSIGIMQANSTRAQNLKAFAASIGKPWNDLSTQLAFVQHELETSEAPAAQRLRAATTVDDATAAFALGYERPQGFQTGNIAQVAGGQNRLDQARRIAGQGGSTVPIPASTTAPSQAQIAANPFAIPAYLDSLKNDDKSEVKVARNVGNALEAQFKGGNLPSPETTAAFLQMADRHPDELKDDKQKVLTAYDGYKVATDASTTLPQGSADAFMAQVHNLTQGSDIYTRQKADVAQEIYTKRAAALKQTPFDEALNRQWIPRPVAPLDFTQPQAVPQAIQDRGQAATVIASRSGEQQMALGPDDLKTFRNGMPTADPQTVGATLGAINRLQPSQIDQLMTNTDFKSTIMGLAHSGDPVKMNQAYSFLDAQYRRNPAAFDAANSDALKDLRVWQALSQFKSPEEVAKKMATASDPSEIKARESLEKTADKNLENLTDSQVINQFGSHIPALGWHVPFTGPGVASDTPDLATNAIMQDYREAYTDMFKEGVGAANADKYAQEKLSNKYSVSAINGGVLMPNAPDRVKDDGTGAFYPKVNGSFGYLHEQLRRDVQGTSFFNNLHKDNPNEARNVARGNDTFLMSDSGTQADIASGRLPSYRVLAKGEDGRLHVVESAPGRAMRWRGDPNAAQSTFEQGIAADQQSRNTMDAVNQAGMP